MFNIFLQNTYQFTHFIKCLMCKKIQQKRKILICYYNLKINNRKQHNV